MVYPNCRSLALSPCVSIQKLCCEECLFPPLVRMVANSPQLNALTYITCMYVLYKDHLYCPNFVRLTQQYFEWSPLVTDCLNLYLFTSLEKQTTTAAILKHILNVYTKRMYCWFVTVDLNTALFLKEQASKTHQLPDYWTWSQLYENKY